MAEYQESDDHEAWTARLLSYAPDPEQFQAGMITPACSPYRITSD